MTWHKLKVEKTFKELDTTQQGLSAMAADEM
jgi:hypothetical protein